MRSPKQRINTLKKVTPWCPVRSNKSGIFATCDKNYGHAFEGLDKVLQETFLPRLFFRRLKTLHPVVGYLSMFLVKKYQPGLQKPMPSSAEKYNSLLRAICDLIGKVKGKREFSTANHKPAVKEERQERKKVCDIENDAKLR